MTILFRDRAGFHTSMDSAPYLQWSDLAETEMWGETGRGHVEVRAVAIFLVAIDWPIKEVGQAGNCAVLAGGPVVKACGPVGA